MGQQLLVVVLERLSCIFSEGWELHPHFLTLSALQGFSRSRYVCPVPISGGPEGGPSHPGKETGSIRLETFMVTLGISPSN